MRAAASLLIALAVLPALASAQVPQPFPRPQTPQTPERPSSPAPRQPGGEPPPAPAPAARPAEAAPDEQTLGFTLYPNSQFITSYDAGRGQRYYLFGSQASFATLVKYYQTLLRTRGNLVFEAPATHIFEMGRFDDKTMAYPPGVTLKDYTWNGAAGYLNPDPAGQPQRFPTVIQIVPLTPAAAR